MPDPSFEPAPSLLRSWLQSRRPLWQAFWLLYVGGHLVLGSVLGWGLTWFMTRPSQAWVESPYSWQIFLAVVGGAVLVMLSYFVLSTMAVWRCSVHAHGVWRWSARSVTALHALWWLTSIGMVVHFYGSGWGEQLLQGLAT